LKQKIDDIIGDSIQIIASFQKSKSKFAQFQKIIRSMLKGIVQSVSWEKIVTTRGNFDTAAAFVVPWPKSYKCYDNRN
jgi:hypothetical protein